MKKQFVTLGGLAVAVVTCVALSSGGSATAAQQIDGATIKNGTVTGTKLANKTVTSGKIGDGQVGNGQLGAGSVSQSKLAPNLYKKLATDTDDNGKGAGSDTVTGVTLTHVGGSVRSGTDSGISLDLPEGTYLLNLNALFGRGAAADPTDPDVIGTLVVYTGDAIDSNFTNAQPGATTSHLSRYTANDTSDTGTYVVEVPAGGQTFHVMAHAYDDDAIRGSVGTVQLRFASLTAVRIG